MHTEISDGLGVPLPKFITISRNDTMAEFNLSITRTDPSPVTLLLKIESTSKQACFENGSDIKIIIFGKFKKSHVQYDVSLIVCVPLKIRCNSNILSTKTAACGKLFRLDCKLTLATK